MEISEEQPGDQSQAQGISGSQVLGGEDCCRMFAWLWGRLSDVLGTPATAALMRRAISVAAGEHPDLRGIVISRERLTYVYSLPDAYCADGVQQLVPAYKALLREVLRLTGELTGGVMVRGLIKNQELSPWLPDAQEVDNGR